MPDNITDEIVKEAQAGNYKRCVTLALMLAARLAREGDRPQAIAIRDHIDLEQQRHAVESAYGRERLRIAAMLMASCENAVPEKCLALADELLTTHAETYDQHLLKKMHKQSINMHYEFQNDA